MPDLVPGHEVAQAWGYVVAGYFLVEESFKALLYLRGKKVPTKHSLTMLFNLFEPDDKEILREYYTDYRETGGWPKKFPIEILDEFLVNLDGDPNKRGDDHIGSFDWRYFLIEEQRSAIMPMVSVEFLHEIAYGCTRMVEHVHNGRFEPSRYTHSWRMRWKRDLKRQDWLTVRMNSDGWDNLPDRLEIVWGPVTVEHFRSVWLGPDQNGEVLLPEAAGLYNMLDLCDWIWCLHRPAPGFVSLYRATRTSSSSLSVVSSAAPIRPLIAVNAAS